MSVQNFIDMRQLSGVTESRGVALEVSPYASTSYRFIYMSVYWGGLFIARVTSALGSPQLVRI